MKGKVAPETSPHESISYRQDSIHLNDLLHYQKILKIFSETDRIMQTIAVSLSDNA